MKVSESRPLVSIVVIAYNSEEYVVETLESIRNQTYPDIELIITDDSSEDSTVVICDDWLKHNKSRFVNTCIITSSTNTGTAHNTNRGIKSASGEWIKTIAGDDLLLPNSISQYVKFIQRNSCNVLAAKRQVFYNNDPDDRRDIEAYDLFNRTGITAAQQYQIALRGYGAPHITWFFRKSFIVSLGLYDERYKLMEDWPMKLKVLKAGEKIAFMPEYTALTRINHESVSQIKGDKIHSSWFIQWMLKVKKELMYPHLPGDEKLIMKYDFLISKVTYHSWLNKNYLINKVINRLLRTPINYCNRYFLRRLEKRIISEV